jgi:hypothetical protein
VKLDRVLGIVELNLFPRPKDLLLTLSLLCTSSFPFSKTCWKNLRRDISPQLIQSFVPSHIPTSFTSAPMHGTTNSSDVYCADSCHGWIVKFEREGCGEYELRLSSVLLLQRSSKYIADLNGRCSYWAYCNVVSSFS